MCCILLLMLHTLHLLLRSIQMYLPAHQLLRVLLPCLWLTNSHLKTVGWCVTKEQVPSTRMHGGYPLSGSKLRSCPLVCLAQSSKSLIRKDSDSQKLMLTLWACSLVGAGAGLGWLVLVFCERKILLAGWFGLAETNKRTCCILGYLKAIFYVWHRWPIIVKSKVY